MDGVWGELLGARDTLHSGGNRGRRVGRGSRRETVRVYAE